MAGRRLWFRVRLFKPETPALVGVVTRRKDWRLVKTKHWYRIPVRTAPDGLERVRFLAFYQTSTFGSERWAVNYYAEVKGISRVRRRELLPDELDHPRADAVYFRIDIGELQRLPRPIPSRRWRRIVFIPTSLERLMKAREINELFRTSQIEERLFSLLCKEGLEAERQFVVYDGENGHMLDLALFCRDGNLNIECDGDAYHTGPAKVKLDRNRDNRLTAAGWRILRFSGREIMAEPESCLKLVKQAVRLLGGINPVEERGVYKPRSRKTRIT
ncbi:MAG: DUF559 domain-containing protein [candidate division WOR-3 bacterium]